MIQATQKGKRALALLLSALLLLAPVAVLAGDATTTRTLNYLSVEGDKNSYLEKPSVNIPEGGFSENTVDAGINPLTGEAWSGTYQPIFVSIDTDPLARPNYGVSDADVIYELPIHRQGNTRSIALFMSTVPGLGAGPVRSARIPMVDIAEEWGAGYTFFGMQEQKGTSVKTYISELRKGGGSATFPYLDLMGAKFSPHYERTNYANPHNVRVNVASLLAEFADSQPKMRPWKFSDEGLDRGASAYSISMEFRPDFVPSFLYNEETRLYDRYYNSEPFVDGNNGKACSFANVIIMRTDVSWYRNNPSRPVVKLTGQGVAEIFMNGRYIRGTWVRAVSKNPSSSDLTARTVFLDENGEEISFLPGKTFIHIVPVAQQVVIGNDPSVGDALAEGKPVPTPKPTKTPKPTRTPRPTRTPKPGAEVTPEPVNAGDEGEVELPDD